MNNRQIIEKTRKFVEKKLAADRSGHDFAHIERVWHQAKALAKKEGGNKFVIELGALLHDIADWKFHKGDLAKGPQAAEAWLRKHKIPRKTIEHVKEIIGEVTYQGAWKKRRPRSIEGKIVQDADRLDALGAIGIARAFAMGTKLGRKMYDRKIRPTLHKNFEQYKKGGTTTVNHFHEKLLRLSKLMNTAHAKKIAEQRHAYMQQFLEKFLKEWHAK